MVLDYEVLTNPLFIIKELQREKIKRSSHFFKGRLLDVGCGVSPYRKYFSAAAYIGMDESKAASLTVRARAESVPFRDESFDCVVSTEVLEHLQEPQECLLEIKRVLKKGGYFYISVPQSWGLHYEPCDYWRFTSYGMRYLLEKCGLELIATQRIGGICSLIGQQFVDCFWTLLARGFSFLGPRCSERAASAFSFPASVVFYLLGKVLDNIDTRFALGWAIIGRK